MSLSQEELEKHCQQILSDSRITNKIVVLCEGKIKHVKGTRSPQAYKRMEQMPDANFYKKCIPKSWNDKAIPQFFNCGDRKDVIDTYFYLLTLHDRKPIQSYLNKSKLFALIDLDIQLQKIDNYDYNFRNTEEIFYSLYNNTKVDPKQIDKHRIWITGLIHKEAYFITPDTQKLFTDSRLCPRYKTDSVLLEDIYLNICDEISKDIDLRNNFDRIVKRIDYCQHINC